MFKSSKLEDFVIDVESSEEFEKLHMEESAKLARLPIMMKPQKKLSNAESIALVSAIRKETNATKQRRLKNELARSFLASSSRASANLMARNSSNTARFSVEDLLQENLLGKWESTIRFDQKRSVNFDNFTFNYGKNQMGSFVKKTLKFHEVPNPDGVKTWTTYVVESLDMHIENNTEKPERLLELNSNEKPILDQLIEDEKRDRVKQLLDQLTRSEVSVLMMYMSGMPYKQISDEVGLSIFTLKTRIHRIKWKLNKMNESVKWA